MCIRDRCTLTAQREEAKFLLSSRPQTGIRSPPISGPRPSFLALLLRVSSSGLRRARRRRARRPRTGRNLRRCLGSTLLWRRSLWCRFSVEMSRSYSPLEKHLFVVPEIFCGACCLLTRVSPSACWNPTALPSSIPAFLRYLTAGCWSWVEIRVRARVIAGCWSCVEIRVRVLQPSIY